MSTTVARRESYDKVLKKIGKTQEKVLRGLIQYQRSNHNLPTYIELAKFLSMDRITVSSRLSELRKKKYVIAIPTRRASMTIQVATKAAYEKLGI